MASILDDIRYGFMQRHGAVAQIIVLNVALYLALAIPGVLFFLAGNGGIEAIVLDYLALPASAERLLQRPWTLLSYMFVHDLRSTLHLIFNMLWLYWFGQILREFMGNARIWPTFIFGALTGAFLYLLAYNTLPVFAASRHVATLVGASAGVYAIMIAAATLVPDYQIGLLFFGAVRLKWVALVFVLIDFLSIQGYNPGGMIAHLGGALYGFLFIVSYRRGVNLSKPFEAIAAGIKKTTDPSARNVRVVRGSTSSKPSSEEVDRILEKIQAVGYDKLTKEEKQTLYNASKQ